MFKPNIVAKAKDMLLRKNQIHGDRNRYEDMLHVFCYFKSTYVLEVELILNDSYTFAAVYKRKLLDYLANSYKCTKISVLIIGTAPTLPPSLSPSPAPLWEGREGEGGEGGATAC